MIQTADENFLLRPTQLVDEHKEISTHSLKRKITLFKITRDPFSHILSATEIFICE